MWKEQVDRISEIAKEYGEDLNPGVRREEADVLEKKLQASIGSHITLPEGYKEFLMTANGFSYNGLMLYGG
ncbi:SMI1/KNR4 family protein [Mesobacillus foraminis]|uniref:SMI1/KNR4 family protein n=1 Tax=Mesobacillus foraminis TaxID=279826 RepID=UPI000EF4BE36|nr:SMI1/KNR4 family protein [Mesobacillus foraminis]